MPRRLSRTESRTAVPSMAVLGCRRGMDLGRRKIAELGPPGSRTLCEIGKKDRTPAAGHLGVAAGRKRS